jgi:hypothetical protein
VPRGPKPKPPGQAVHRNPVAHDWSHAPSSGWQYGDVPECPADLNDEARKAWSLWFGSWWASFWTPADVPQIELAARLFAAAVDDVAQTPKLLPLMDKLGITPKGRQDLRWAAPKGDEAAQEAENAAVTDEVAARRESRRSRIS